MGRNNGALMGFKSHRSWEFFSRFFVVKKWDDRMVFEWDLNHIFTQYLPNIPGKPLR